MTLAERAYNNKGNNLWLITCACDMVAILLSIVMVNVARFCLGMKAYPVDLQLAFAAITLILAFVTYLVTGLYSSRRFRPFSFEVERIVLSNVFVTIILFAILFMFHKDDTSRSMVLLFFGVASLAVILERWIWRKVIARYRRQGIGLHKLLLVGSGEAAEKFYTEIVKAGRSADYGFEYYGYVACCENPKLENWLGQASECHKILKSGAVTEVLIASEILKFDAMGRMITTASRCGVRISVIPSFNDFYPRGVADEVVGDQRMITLQQSPNTNPAWALMKRFFDIIGSIVGLVIGSPFMLVAAILIKTASPEGPVIFKQQRVGRNGQPFTMYKLRTMVPDAEAELKELLEKERNDDEHLVIKIDNDPRIIKHGAFLRKYSIDELPQFWNVASGSMSLVGPRPSSQLEVDDYDDWEWARLAVKPGLTCFWQVSGRSDIGFDEWMQLDLKYVREQCFSTDAKLIFKTFGAVFKGRGAQ